MLYTLVRLPKIKDGKDAEFREWFARSNEAFSKYPGFISRVLLEPNQGGNYASVVMHESLETFLAMHNSEEHDVLRNEVDAYFEGDPRPEFYTKVIG
ncbi:antibiotic biosynthesis monooxygenase family protein [Mycolicibacterium alvei]|jgi:heme-degrading monooxygenase HmoA|uniref:ABM domain-containing protein n=1 Tax=Mycolicibacterium alvei TaxID=67081 RepID=A0A6N4UND0_9MYCO|nr:antibiotic biosynthesis monooxygenase [Mycolicibacterium alvei]MCV7002711.1 antibiotic biosynthesis monooxygenase [Mycolicibacterium alvei]BBX25137.1 hypothetical protein MALV_02620 [Mycolicibacterium alvei]